MPHILALDQGTTSSRAILFDSDGAPRAVAQREFEQIFPHPGWVEHDPSAIWATQAGVVSEVLANASVNAREIAAVGITNQRETTVVWERATGRPIANAIVWQDRRTAEHCDRLRADGCGPMVAAKTGLVIDAYFSGTKLAWILDNVPGARARAERGELAFGTVDTWLVWNLTGGRVHVTEPSNASRTMLFNIKSGAWDDELLSLLGIPASILPEVSASSAVVGDISTDEIALCAPIAGMAGDQQAALFGQRCTTPGLVKNTYGTGCFMLLNTGAIARPSANKLLTTVAWRLGDDLVYAIEGSVFIGGAVVQWLRDGLGIIASAADVEPLAKTVDDSGGVCFIPAFAGLGAPHWDQYARGTIVGLTRGTSAAHIARAALDGIAHQVADVLEAMSADAAVDIPELRVDGGAAANDLLMQIQADVTGVPVVRPVVTETTALGAAYLAGLAVGVWSDRDELDANWSVDRRFEPQRDPAEAKRERARWRSALDRARGWEKEA